MDGETRSSPGPHLRMFVNVVPYARFAAVASADRGLIADDINKPSTPARRVLTRTEGRPGSAWSPLSTSLVRYAFFFAAATRADWNFATSLLCKNRPSAVSTAVFQALLATTPCVSEPASLSFFHCDSAHLR